MTEATKFCCPTCETPYKVVRVEAPTANDRELLCLGCGGPLRNREGKFAEVFQDERLSTQAPKWPSSETDLNRRMAEYRVFTVGRDAHYVSFRKFTCKDDSEAIVWAKHLLDRFPVELWSGNRLVIRLEPASDRRRRFG